MKPKSKKGKKKGRPSTVHIPKSRKERRKEERQQKKLKRVHYFEGKKKKGDGTKEEKGTSKTSNSPKVKDIPERNVNATQIERTKVASLQSEMTKNRKRQLLAANKEEDRNISHLEKLLKLKKRKSKSLPKSFSEDGLGYLLEVCDSNNAQDAVKAEQALLESGSEFEDDFYVVTGKKVKKAKVKSTKDAVDHASDEDTENERNIDQKKLKRKKEDNNKKLVMDSDDGDPSDSDLEDNDEELDDFGTDSDNDSVNAWKHKEVGLIADDDDDESDKLNEGESEDSDEADWDSGNSDDDNLESENSDDTNQKSMKQRPKSGTKLLESNRDKLKTKSKETGNKKKVESETEEDEDSEFEIKEDSSPTANKSTWEDIYGRTRNQEGEIVEKATQGKYVPPALRAKASTDEDIKRKEQLSRLRKQIKGLINRLAEKNLANIATQIENLYMSHSRHDMNESLTELILESLVLHSPTPERLIMENVLLIAVLHANVGTEVGAHFLLAVIKKFEALIKSSPIIENKEVDNIILILSHLYNFKVFSASLMYEVIDTIASEFCEKNIELLLIVLRSVGLSLRKDDPLAIKNLILKLQKNASSASDLQENSRVKFMLEVLMAVKNNNMAKIPGYNPEHSEHLKKFLRSLLRRGNYVNELKISLEDLLQADERGKWWVVGSAWKGHAPDEEPVLLPKPATAQTEYSSAILELARKQRMSSGVRKDIFCILMTAEDYMDAFEKLLHLNLKQQQRQEIVYVLFDCALREKKFNPYYAHLAQKLCEFDRQYQMKFQYHLWDKLKEVDSLSSNQMNNLSRFVAHLLLEMSLPLSVLKVVSFADMDKSLVRLLRQILLFVLLAPDREASEAVFRRIAPSPQLSLFREGLRIFINHFIVRNNSKKSLEAEDAAILEERIGIVMKTLSSADSKLQF